MFKLGIKQGSIVRQNTIANYRYIPIEVVNKLRYDPLWKEVIEHLEQGQLGLGIRYDEVETKEEVKEVEQKVKDEVNELKDEVNQLKTKEKVENGAKMRQRASIKVRDTTKTTIQISKEFKKKLKKLKGSKSYEELLIERMNI